jgi:hypothetical protein
VTDFRALLTALARSNVDFIVVGGLAATVHGSSRLTQDVDVLYSRTPENLQKRTAASNGLTNLAYRSRRSTRGERIHSRVAPLSLSILTP